MPLTLFRVRNAARDRETDADRFRRLHERLHEIRTEMESERDGLRGRYERVTADAAFSQQALEDGAGGAVSARVDEMTDAMIRYTQRIASLDAQIDFVTGIDHRLERFSVENEGDDVAPPVPAGRSA